MWQPETAQKLKDDLLSLVVTTQPGQADSVDQTILIGDMSRLVNLLEQPTSTIKDKIILYRVVFCEAHTLRQHVDLEVHVEDD